MPDVHERLIRALIARSGGAAVAIRGARHEWASATFVGMRHALTLALAGDAADRMRDGIAEHQFAIPGHIVADIMIVARRDEGGESEIDIEALTIEAQ